MHCIENGDNDMYVYGSLPFLNTVSPYADVCGPHLSTKMINNNNDSRRRRQQPPTRQNKLRGSEKSFERNGCVIIIQSQLEAFEKVLDERERKTNIEWQQENNNVNSVVSLPSILSQKFVRAVIVVVVVGERVYERIELYIIEVKVFYLSKIVFANGYYNESDIYQLCLARRPLFVHNQSRKLIH